MAKRRKSTRPSNKRSIAIWDPAVEVTAPSSKKSQAAEATEVYYRRPAGLPTEVVNPRLVVTRGQETSHRLALAAFRKKTQQLRFNSLGVQDYLDSMLVIAAFQASGFIEADDAKFSNRELMEPLPLGIEGVDIAAYEDKYHAREWIQVDENSLIWESISLWGRDVVALPPRPDYSVKSQQTTSGMVEQWRALMELAIQYRRSVDHALTTGFYLSEAGCLPNDLWVPIQPIDRQRIYLGGESPWLLFAAFPRAIVDHVYERSDQTSTRYEPYWRRGIVKRNEHGKALSDANGNYEYSETWECTHQSTYAGSAVLAWAFAQCRLRRIFDALRPLYRAQMPATAKCLAQLGPILGWKEPDFDTVRQVELELIAVAPKLVRPGKSTRTSEPLGWKEARRHLPLRWSKQQLCEHMGNISGTMFDRIRDAAGIDAPPRGGIGAQHTYGVEEVKQLIVACEQVDKVRQRVLAKNWAVVGQNLQALLTQCGES